MTGGGDGRCYCKACLAGDALPDHLQGWPGAYQLTLLNARTGKVRPMTPDEALRDACNNRCAAYGEPPCYELCRDAGEPFTACEECAIDLGLATLEQIDPAAVVAPLL